MSKTVSTSFFCILSQGREAFPLKGVIEPMGYKQEGDSRMSEEIKTNETIEEKEDSANTRTFTQEQVNAIVGKRLAEAKASKESELGKKETELNEREMQIRAKEVLAEKGLPKDLAKVLKYSDEETLLNAISVVERAGVNTRPDPVGPRMIDPKPLPEGEHTIETSFREAMGLK